MALRAVLCLTIAAANGFAGTHFGRVPFTKIHKDLALQEPWFRRLKQISRLKVHKWHVKLFFYCSVKKPL